MSTATSTNRRSLDIQARRTLVSATKRMWVKPDVRARIKALKKKSLDFNLWHKLLECASTLGNSKGYERLMKNPANYERVNLPALTKLPRKRRVGRIRVVLRDAGVRYPNQKARWLAENMELLEQMGGLRGAKKKLEAARGAGEKIAFLRHFQGVGPKYARNIMMDVYHPDFRRCIAVDARIKSVSQTLGLSFGTYGAEEQFYVEVADAAGIEPWALDRIIYWFKKDILKELQTP